jgi:sugar (pentulose or hexulose) kinase
MSDVYFIGVDGGSQSTKVSIFNQSGDVVCSARQPLKPMVSRLPGYMEHPDDDLWDSLKVVLQRVMGEFQGDPGAILGLGLCSIRCCRVFLRADGTLAAPVMSWMGVRAYETFEDHPDISYTCSTTGYLTHRLTGEFRDAAANAYPGQFPVDVETWAWSTDAQRLGEFRIPRSKLLEIHLPGAVLGRVTPGAAAETGLPVGLPVVATANDKAVEALGAGLTEPNLGLVSLGTYSASMVYGTTNRPAATHLFTNMACVPHRYLYEAGGIRKGMGHISWFTTIVGEEYAAKASEDGRSVEEALGKEAAAVPAGSDGLLTIPDWLAPASQRHRKGVILGFDDRHTRGHIFRSLLEGIAMTLMNSFDDMNRELGIRPDTLIVSGGGASSDLVMEILADVSGVKTTRNEVTGAAALGAAICAAVAAGVYRDAHEAAGHMVKRRDEFLPNPQNHRVYSRINDEAYRRLGSLLEPALKALHRAAGEDHEDVAPASP